MKTAPSLLSSPKVEDLIRIWFRLAHEFVTLPVTMAALLYNKHIHPAYRMTAWRRLRLAWRIYRNQFRILTATSWKAHLAMAAKLLEIGPEVEGVVVECGCFLGGSTASLSLVCDIVGRQLIIYDSFEGLPAPAQGEKYAIPGSTGGFRGELHLVQENIRKGGVIERCTFRKGWLKDTLPHHSEPIAMCFWDVDYQDSLHTCVINLWPHLVEGGYVFIDEYVLVDYCSLFFSERYWRQYFGTTPPGLIGSGTGLPLGHYFLGGFPFHPPLQESGSVAYTRKGGSGFWDYYPEDIAAAAEDAPLPATAPP